MTLLYYVKNIDNITTILYKENHEKINKPEEIKILKETASQNTLYDVINGKNDPLYKILLSVES
jgi:hypothetical protein